MELSKQPYTYICFELLRLRSRYDNEKDNAVKVRIAKRYREVRKEFDSRGSQWTPSEHELDRIIKAVEEVKKQGEEAGKWVTMDNGQKVFIREGESFNEAIGRLREERASREDLRRERIGQEKIPEDMKSTTIKDKGQLEKYATMNDRRKELWSAYQKELDKSPKGFDELIKRRVIIGSFVTDKENPGDIDVVLFTDPEKTLYNIDKQPKEIQDYYWEKFNESIVQPEHRDVTIMLFDDTPRSRIVVNSLIEAGQGKIRGYGKKYKGVQH